LDYEELCLFRLCPGERSASHLRKKTLPVEFEQVLCLWKSAAVPAKTSRVSARVSRSHVGHPLLPDVRVSGKPFRTGKQASVSRIVLLDEFKFLFLFVLGGSSNATSRFSIQ
jgi:hypothetical protein